MKRTYSAISLLFGAILITMTACSSGGTAPSNSTAQTEADSSTAAHPAPSGDARTISVGCNGSEEHVHIMGLRLFEKILEEKSGGAIQVEVFPNSILGSEREMVESTIMGSLDMVVSTIDGTAAGWVPNGQIYSVPYLFDTLEDARDVSDNFLLDRLQEDYEAVGLHNLAIMELGFRHFTNNKRPINSAADMEGMLIRVQEAAVWETLLDSLKATPSPIAFNELYSAMQQGVIDGQENPIAIISAQKYYEVQKYLVLDGHTYSAGGVFMNLDLYNDLSDQERTWVEEAIFEANKQQREVVDSLTEQRLEECKKAGMEIVEHPDLESFKAATADFVNHEKVKEAFDISLVDEVKEYLSSKE
ncbi:TRAP transporter substrate-binding protein DctP [Lachnospiraceae bacterium 62-35]